MKKKIITVSVVFIIVTIIVCINIFLLIPKSIANAQAKTEMYLFIEDVNQPLPKTDTVISNKKVGLYVNPYNFQDGSSITIMSTDNRIVYEVKDNITYFPIKDGVTYTINVFSKTLSYEIPANYITYDLQKPYITAETMRYMVDSGDTIVGQTVIVNAYDNLMGVEMFVSKNGENAKSYEDMAYIIAEEGTYIFYAVDIAGNCSDEFTITYYKQVPVTNPDEPKEPDTDTPPIIPIEPEDPIIPTEPTEPEEPITNNESTNSQGRGIIVIIGIGAIIIVGIVIVVVYRRIKAKSTTERFDDDE